MLFVCCLEFLEFKIFEYLEEYYFEEGVLEYYCEYFNWFKNEFLLVLREFVNEIDFMEFYRIYQDYYMEDLRFYGGVFLFILFDEFMEEYVGVFNVMYVFFYLYLVVIYGYSLIIMENNRMVWGVVGFFLFVRRDFQRMVWSYKIVCDIMMGFFF